MIRFACPVCKTSLQSRDQDFGTKFACPACGQRVQVPAPPPPNKTVLGQPTPALDVGRNLDDDEDGFAERRRVRKRRCANCGSTDVFLKKQVHVGGWLIMGISLFMAWFFFILGFFTCVTFFLCPLCLLGLFGLMWTEDHLVCFECGYSQSR